VQAAAVVAEAERARTFDTLTLAFAADPVERWLYPEPQRYLASFPMFLAAFAGEAFARETVWQIGDFSAIALWLPPGTQADGDAIVSALAQTVDTARHKETFAVLEQMDEAHPSFPHWYLPWLGVDPARQGQGLGGELIEQCLRIVDEDHLPAYLETPNPRTIAFYEHYGFEVSGEAQAGACPPVTLMLRAAR
jgi:ribosomal protein S18 acetylase RimI-like enzyme